MSFREELEDYAERSSELIEESPQMDEENTKRKIIEPLLELLGWNIISSDVELEYSVPMGAGTKKVDYALILDGAPVVFVEAKGSDTTIVDSHIDQLRSYMRQVGVDWGLITNGREFQIYRRDHAASRPNEISLAEFSLEEMRTHENPLKALSRDSIDKGESEQIAEKIESVKQSVELLRERKESIAEDVTQVVTGEIGETVSQRVEDEAKNFIDDLIVSLTTQAHRAEVTDPSPGPESSQNDEYVIRVLENETELTEVSAKTQSETMGALVNYLITEHDLLNEIEIPYVPGTGRGTRALINTEPVHTNGVEMRASIELESGYYLYTTLSAKDKIRYLSELPEKVGLRCEFSDNWQ